MGDATEVPVTQDLDEHAADGWIPAIVEIFGHRKHAGFTREEEKFGAKMLRIDVPTSGDPAEPKFETFWYGGASIFSYMLTDTESAYRANRPWRAPARVALPAPDEDESGADDEPF